MPAAALPVRERILAAAHDLFYRDGIRATGVDAIIAASGVAKLTFYRQFPSKDELVLAFLEMRHDRWMGWFIDALGRHGAQRELATDSALEMLADVLQEWADDPGFRGCAFINAVSELGTSRPDALALARSHKREMEDVIALLLPDTAGRGRLAQAAALAFDGAVIHAQRDPAPQRGADASAALRRLLQGLVCTQR